MNFRCLARDCSNWVSSTDCRARGLLLAQGGRCRHYTPRDAASTPSQQNSAPPRRRTGRPRHKRDSALPDDCRITYRLEMVSCGKCKRCREEGPSHGPYWYAYWKEDGKTRSKYIGKGAPVAESRPPAR